MIVEVDARYIKGMLANPDLNPGASINRWILSILTFHFVLIHVPGTMHGPDGLSRRRPQPGDGPEPDDDFDDWIDNLYGFMHMINVVTPQLPDQTSIVVFAVRVADTELLPGDTPPASYDDIPRTLKAQSNDTRLVKVRQWLETLTRPADLSDVDFANFVHYAMHFFVTDDRLWRKDEQGRHKLVATPLSHFAIMRAAHDNLTHKGFYATNALVAEHFWWPAMHADLVWFIRTCHLCQLRQMRNILIPPVVANPVPLFTKIYVNTMHLPKSNGYKYLVQGRCSLTHYIEFRKLRTETAMTLGDWLFEDVLCRWGTISEIVSDNGPPFIKALEYLAKKYHIHHIRISGYNSRANSLVEWSHFDVRQVLYKSVDGVQSQWSKGAYSIFWADRVTIRHRMGCSPYFAVTGTHPILPLDIAEATYLLPPPSVLLSTTELIAVRAIALQKRRAHLSTLHSKVMAAHVQAAVRFERTHPATVRDFNFQRGDLVLVRNTAIEKALNRKMRPRYTGLVVVISRNQGGAYVLCELNGSVFDCPVTAFRIIPYFAQKSLALPNLNNFLDVPISRIEEMEQSTSSGDSADDEDVPLDDKDAAAVSYASSDDGDSIPD
jgi:hypothetical protein